MATVALLHNWGTPLKETLEFKTNVFTSGDGSEQRRGERFLPRRSVDMSSRLRGDSFRLFESMLHGRDELSTVIPDYGKAQIGGSIKDSQTIIVIGTTSWLVSGASVCVFNETEIVSTTATSVLKYTPSGQLFTLSNPPDYYEVKLADQVPNGMSGYAYLLPAATVHISQKVTLKTSTDEVGDYAVTAMVDPGTETIATITESAATLQTMPNDGREILLLKPNYAQPPTASMNANFDAVDYGRGVREFFKPFAFPTSIMQYGYTGRRASKIAPLIGLFCRSLGRLKEFFAPTWVADLRASGGILAGAAYLRVAGTFTQDPVNVGVLIELNDGTLLPYMITSYIASTNSDTQYPVPTSYEVDFSPAFGFPQYGLDPIQTVLLLSGSVPYDILYTDIARVSWLRLARFAQDTMTVNWQNNDVATCQISLQSLPYKAAETV